MTRLHHVSDGDERPHGEHPLNAYYATTYALASARGFVAPGPDDMADAAHFIADLRAQGCDVQPFAGHADGQAVGEATAHALVAMRGITEAGGLAPVLLTELRSLGFDVRRMADAQ